MTAVPQPSAEELAQLRGCLNDLISVSALPAVWNGSEPAQIVTTLLDALIGMLGLAFVFVRLNDADDAPPIEMMRTAAPLDRIARPRDLGEALGLSADVSPQQWVARATLHLDDTDFRVASARLGLQGDIGLVVAGSQRLDFPAPTEALLIQVATNQAAIGLQHAQLLNAQRRITADLDERVAQRTIDWKQAQDELRNTQSALAHMTRVMTMGELTASIAHEVNQPLSGIVTNAGTCLRMLAADPPDIDGARETARRTIRDGNRASEVIKRLRALFKNNDVMTDAVDVNDAIGEVIAIASGQLQKNRVVLRPEMADPLPLIMGDRIQLQQVVLNLMMNASDAMSSVEDRERQLRIRTERAEGDGVCVTIRDTGIGFDPDGMNHLFDAFVTTKNTGMGLGLSVSRSIIARHQGRLWAELNDGPGATFGFFIPCRPADPTSAGDAGL